MVNSSTPKDTLMMIIMVLLVLIAIAMIYNYWTIYYYSSSSSSEESYDNLKSTTREMQPIVKSTVQKISQYKNGEISPKLSKMSLENDKRMKQENVVDKIGTTKVDSMKNVQKQEVMKNDNPEKGKTKLCIYHMQGCGHCDAIMSVKQSNGKTVFETIKDTFADDKSVQVLDFKYGRDKDANKYNAFPVIAIVTEKGRHGYTGQRTPEHMITAVQNARNKN